MKKPLTEDEIKRIFNRRKFKGPKKSKTRGLHANVDELAKAIKQNAALSNQKCITHTLMPQNNLGDDLQGHPVSAGIRR